MSSSAVLGKIYISLMAMKLYDAGAVRTIVDCGCGCGTYHNMLSAHLPGVRWTGVEVWEPYVEEFNLRNRYDRIVIADCRHFDFASVAPADLVIFGDMVEHMTKEEAIAMVDRARAVAPYVMISIPVVKYPQDAEGGNPFEAHVKDDWSHNEVLQTFSGIIAFLIHGFIGVYILTNAEGPAGLVTDLQTIIPDQVREQIPKDSLAWGGWYIRNHL